MSIWARRVWFAVFAANVGLILFFWWRSSGELFAGGISDIALAVGRLSGLAAALTVLLQFFFMSRTLWLERVFGFDALSRMHHASGTWSFVFLLVHPALVTYSYSASGQLGLVEQFANLLTYPHVIWAALGMFLFVCVVASSIYIVRNRVRYEAWYFVHLLVYAAVFASFWHQVELGGTLLASELFYWYWITLYIVVFGQHLIFRFVAPVYHYLRHGFTVTDIERESHNVISLTISGKYMERFTVRPGQFMIFRFFARGMWWQSHPFSLSRPQKNGNIRITVKELGDFTRQLRDLKKGTKVMIEGPFGVFVDRGDVPAEVLLVAGGIGITPLRSLAEEMVEKGKDVVLLYGARTKADLVFYDELTQLSHGSELRVVPVLSEQKTEELETGIIDAELMRRVVPDVENRSVYVCGPAGMLDALLPELERIGIPSDLIYWERFSLP